MDGDRALALYNEGRSLLQRGERTAAIAKLTEASLVAPHFKTYEVLGEALLESGRCQEACVYLAAAVGLGRDQSKSRYLLARALLKLGNDYMFDAAIQLTKALEKNRDYRSAKELLDETISAHPELTEEIREYLG